MNPIYRDIFKAIHEGKWLSIEYKNQEDKITKYWIGIQDINVSKRSLKVSGLHLRKYSLDTFDCIYIDSIVSSKIVEGSYCERNEELLKDIYLNPHKYRGLFDHIANLKILNYLEDCSLMDVTPYKADFELVNYLDSDSFQKDCYELNEAQFQKIVNNFQYKATSRKTDNGKITMQRLCMNYLSIHTQKGLYVLAYRRLALDVKQRMLKPENDITICTEFTIDGKKESIRKYLDAEDYELLRDFEKNQEIIKDRITGRRQQRMEVDDLPYIVGLGMDLVLDLHKEYTAIMDQYQKGEVSTPINAFFGNLISRPPRKKAYPITLLDRRINLDQLLAINNAMKYPVAYIQGPPGTGKTSTIVNTIITAFFNEKTVLFTSYNNHPIDGVFDKLTTFYYKGKPIYLPVIRLGNREKVKEALKYIKEICEKTKDITVFKNTLDKNREDRIKRAKKLSDILRRYEETLDLKERNDTISRLWEYNKRSKAVAQMLPFQADLEGQLNKVNQRMKDIGGFDEEETIRLLDDDEEEFRKYLYYTSVKYIKRIHEPKNTDLMDIVFLDNDEEQVKQFNKYLSKEENIKKFQRIFPIVITTCISAHKIGEPKSCFDMVIMDEASQCNTAVSLVPILRGKSLMLVGDPQQLSPVILLDEVVNQKLRKKYMVTEEYDYCRNSVYKTFLACDAVSDEILLHYHYRCNKQIIEFNNKKYYNSKLDIKTSSTESEPLVYFEIENSRTNYKNTAPAEVEQIVKYAKMNRDKSIGVITPFVSQKEEIENCLKENRLGHITCGTVHAFQGDEKDVVLFSTAITDKTQMGTYEWLKNNQELINVATSRAKEKLIVLCSTKNLERLHKEGGKDDLYELIHYVKSKGTSHITQKDVTSRALGVKPFSTETEEAFLMSLNHALENIWLSQNKFVVEKEVAISHVFLNNRTHEDLFYSGRFDFVVYERQGKEQIPVLAIELDGKEYFENEVVQNRDKKKNQICRAHNMELIRIENSYARRYNHIKEILNNYFSVVH